MEPNHAQPVPEREPPAAGPEPATDPRPGARAEPAQEPGASPLRDSMRDPRARFALHAAASGALGFLVAALWAVTGFGTFWPLWVWFGLIVLLSLEALPALVGRAEPGRKLLALNLCLAAIGSGVMLMVWLFSGPEPGGFWPAIPILCLAGLVGCHAVLLEVWGRYAESARERQLSERVDQLTRTRRGALEVQAAELRRVERDLHDGAQSRLVALSMQLGRAESRLSDRPEEAELVRRAREEAGEAIAELRDLARGIAPPVLADRGLTEAVRSLARRSASRARVDSELTQRPPAVVETAAYFVAAEALTNAAKHAPGAPVAVRLALDGDELVLEVSDQGPGGADPGGGGLTGLRHRVEAVDGTLAVTSPPGGGTRMEVRLPCA